MQRTPGTQRRSENQAKQVVTTTLFEILWAISEVTEEDDEALAVFAELVRGRRVRSDRLSGLLAGAPAFAA